MMLLLFALLLVLAVLAVVLAYPFGVMSLEFVTALAVVALGVIAWFLYDRVKQIIVWINGKPIDGGPPGVVLRGVDWWIKKSTFQMGPNNALGDPEPNKPVLPPPVGF